MVFYYILLLYVYLCILRGLHSSLGSQGLFDTIYKALAVNFRHCTAWVIIFLKITVGMRRPDISMSLACFHSFDMFPLVIPDVYKHIIQVLCKGHPQQIKFEQAFNSLVCYKRRCQYNINVPIFGLLEFGVLAVWNSSGEHKRN